MRPDAFARTRARLRSPASATTSTLTALGDGKSYAPPTRLRRRPMSGSSFREDRRSPRRRRIWTPRCEAALLEVVAATPSKCIASAWRERADGAVRKEKARRIGRPPSTPYARMSWRTSAAALASLAIEPLPPGNATCTRNEPGTGAKVAREADGRAHRRGRRQLFGGGPEKSSRSVELCRRGAPLARRGEGLDGGATRRRSDAEEEVGAWLTWRTTSRGNECAPTTRRRPSQRAAPTTHAIAASATGRRTESAPSLWS